VHLYIHVPFCARRCTYCDFAIAVRRQVPSQAYTEVVLREWADWQLHEIWSLSDRIETVYFGGGTPSRLEPDAVARLLERIGRDRPLAEHAEVTLEANPDDVTGASARAWRAAGVNRVSLGAQSFDSAALGWMHRTHSEEQTGAAVEALRAAGMPELSLDLIFGLPTALGRDWPADLDRAIALGPDHLSLYGLTVEDHTPLGRWAARGEVTPVDEERYAAEFLEADARLGSVGYEHYEVSNYARNGRRARHNSAYWRRAPYIGIGPSAHSGWEGKRRWNLREWSGYERAVRAGESPVGGAERLEPGAVELEQLYLGLRTLDGVPVDRLSPETARAWIQSGWARSTGSVLGLTPEGWLRLDALALAAR
jgi:oxygen-independent coproporphyrinogen-3 oxidase